MENTTSLYKSRYKHNVSYKISPRGMLQKSFHPKHVAGPGTSSLNMSLMVMQCDTIVNDFVSCIRCVFVNLVFICCICENTSPQKHFSTDPSYFGICYWAARHIIEVERLSIQANSQLTNSYNSHPFLNSLLHRRLSNKPSKSPRPGK